MEAQTSYTLHDTGCGSAVGMPVVTAEDYPDARKHRCVIHADPQPEQYRVTEIEGEIPPAPPE
jgi:hypothetical protein